MGYCDEGDVMAITRSGSIPTEARLCASVLASANQFELDGHPFQTGDSFTLRIEEGGTLPAASAAGVTYYAIRDSGSFFRAASSYANAIIGSHVDLITDGDLVLVVRERPMAEWIEWATSEVEQMLPAHVIPLEAPVPSIVRAVTAKLAAWQGRVWAGTNVDDLAALLDETRKQLARWGRGVPVRQNANGAAQGAANLATSRAVTADGRGWEGAAGCCSIEALGHGGLP